MTFNHTRNESPRQYRMDRSILHDTQGELHHYCHPLVDPQWVSVDRASHMQPSDPVLGLEFGGHAWALPWWIMKNHHVANLMLGDRAVLVTLCEVCTSAAAFDPVLDGHRHTFRLGGLCNGTIMPMDHETESLWTGFTGEAIEGPLKGRVMERLLLLQCTWQEWASLHPHTTVPDGEAESREGHGEGHSPGSPLVPETFRLLQEVDGRLPHHELVLGVYIGGHSRCYPLTALERHGASLNDTLGGEDIVVFSRPGSWMASAYHRLVDGRRLTFRTEGGLIVDEQTGSRWEISGLASSGPLRDRQLRYVHSGIEEFIAWFNFRPETDIYGQDSSAAASPQPAHHARDREPVPRVVRRLLDTDWWPRGTTLLNIECGDGLIAAWLAEAGLNVHAIDASPERVAQARRSFRGVVRLDFEVMDIRRPLLLDRKFDALVHSGSRGNLTADEQAIYLSNVATAANPGARFLLIMPSPGNALKQRFCRNLVKLFEPSFRALDARETSLPHPGTGAAIQGVALRFVRR